MQHEFFAEITGRVQGTPQVMGDETSLQRASARIEVTQDIETGHGMRSVTLRLKIWTDAQRWIDELRLYRDGDPIQVWCKQLRPALPWRKPDEATWRAGREGFVVDYLEPAAAAITEMFRVEITGRLGSDPGLGSDRFGRFGHLELMVNQRSGHGRDSATCSQLFHARVYDEDRALWLRRRLHQDDLVTVACTSLIPGRLRAGSPSRDDGEYSVDPPLFNLVAVRPAAGDPADEGEDSPGGDAHDADAAREAQTLAGLL
ncbi:hypothetical protein AGRA3207_007489 [Actinomadura graeca]|uniref:Uncharacterized protein n=1 Tax=Actinomadura graeca TaxID=2750812 RepID=A0ABX8R4D4_9ACTN|nr:hypothetical protein [Actinomadura graeca]QXJ25920.1 hypothetical protein AGRA3207_007489 [Actinomadura graeca]